MLQIRQVSNDEIALAGRLDSTTADMASRELADVARSCTLDFAEVDYISSAGLSVLLSIQQRLSQTGQELSIANLRKPLLDVFRIAGFDRVFRIRA